MSSFEQCFPKKKKKKSGPIDKNPEASYRNHRRSKEHDLKREIQDCPSGDGKIVEKQLTQQIQIRK